MSHYLSDFQDLVAQSDNVIFSDGKKLRCQKKYFGGKRIDVDPRLFGQRVRDHFKQIVIITESQIADDIFDFAYNVNTFLIFLEILFEVAKFILVVEGENSVTLENHLFSLWTGLIIVEKILAVFLRRLQINYLPSYILNLTNSRFSPGQFFWFISKVKLAFQYMLSCSLLSERNYLRPCSEISPIQSNKNIKPKL